MDMKIVIHLFLLISAIIYLIGWWIAKGEVQKEHTLTRAVISITGSLIIGALG